MMRPCGACRSLVDDRKGCMHWQGFGASVHDRGQRRVANTRYARAARERARADVAEFARAMGRRY